MNISDFDYNLPEELIAQEPVEPRDASRLMVLHRDDGRIEHRHFRDIIEYLRPGDVLVVNESRVIPARLHGRKADTGGRVEVLLLSSHEGDTWETLVRPGRRIQPGLQLVFDLPGGEQVRGEVLDRTEAGGRLIRFTAGENSTEPVDSLLERLGAMPLPPYIHVPLQNPERYQTVYSRVKGSVAAPTAGLHFTPELMAKLQDMGIEIVRVLLHIGLDTFRPVSEEHVEEHKIHSEEIEFPVEAAEALNRARAEGRRIIAVGTTSVRVLETVGRFAEEQGTPLQPYRGRTQLYIYPGYKYRVVDALITNFHLPRSTLLMLVSAFAGHELIMRAYHEAVVQRYRFFSFGDAMVIL